MSFTAEQLEQLKSLIAESVGSTVNAAVTSHLKRDNARRSEELAQAIDSALEKRISELPQPEAKAREPQSQLSPEQEKRISLLEKQNAALVQQLEATAAKQAAAEQKARETSAYSQLGGLLERVRPEHREALLAKWRVEGRIQFADDGTPTLRVRRSPGHGLPAEEQDLSLAEGVATWLSSKDAEPWLPAPQPNVRRPPPPPPPSLQRPSGPYDHQAALERTAARFADDPELFSQ